MPNLVTLHIPSMEEWQKTDEVRELAEFIVGLLKSSDQVDFLEQALRQQYGGSEIYFRATPPINDNARDNIIRKATQEYFDQLRREFGIGNENSLRQILHGRTKTAIAVADEQSDLFTENH